MCFAAMASSTRPQRLSLSRPRRPRPRGCVSDPAGRTERLDVLLLGLALPRRHGRARVVLDHGAEVTCGDFACLVRHEGGWGFPQPSCNERSVSEAVGVLEQSRNLFL